MNTIRARGLTLVEILVAMATLVIGVSAVTMMLLTGARFTRSSLERNAATMLISEAIPEIERRHLITESMIRDGLPPLVQTQSDPHLGLLIETVDSPNPNIHDSTYSIISIGNNLLHKHAFDLKCFDTMMPNQIHMSMWPMPPHESPKTYGSLENVLKRGDSSLQGTPLRVLYRLERHQDWHSHTIDASGAASYPGSEDDNSPFRGVYVLTLMIYKDSKRDGSMLEQIAEPYVVFLNDKRVR
jgi:hypothetical protein